jgi:hypothetical protein
MELNKQLQINWRDGMPISASTFNHFETSIANRAERIGLISQNGFNFGIISYDGSSVLSVSQDRRHLNVNKFFGVSQRGKEIVQTKNVRLSLTDDSLNKIGSYLILASNSINIKESTGDNFLIKESFGDESDSIIEIDGVEHIHSENSFFMIGANSLSNSELILGSYGNELILGSIIIDNGKIEVDNEYDFPANAIMNNRHFYEKQYLPLKTVFADLEDLLLKILIGDKTHNATSIFLKRNSDLSNEELALVRLHNVLSIQVWREKHFFLDLAKYYPPIELFQRIKAIVNMLIPHLKFYEQLDNESIKFSHKYRYFEKDGSILDCCLEFIGTTYNHNNMSDSFRHGLVVLQILTAFFNIISNTSQKYPDVVVF